MSTDERLAALEAEVAELREQAFTIRAMEEARVARQVFREDAAFRAGAASGERRSGAAGRAER